jgi:crotonobetainyl-CoA:carnitine CoA-transferase CaiB-like acyl-CoA transferase
LAAPDDASFERLARLAATNWLTDPRFSSAEARLAHAEALDAEVAAWTRRADGPDLERRLIAAGLPAHRVFNSHDAFEDPHLATRGHFVPIEYADLGSVPFENARAQLSATPAKPGRCPTLGQHNPTVLSELLGLDEDAITRLVIDGVIQ